MPISYFNIPVWGGPKPYTYKKIGELYPNDSFDIIWKERDCYYIEYTVDGTSTKKRGYIGTSNFTATCPECNYQSVGTRYVNTAAYGNYGPGAKYAQGDTLRRSKKVQYLGFKPGGYAFIEYDAEGSTIPTRQFFWANYLSVDKPA